MPDSLQKQGWVRKTAINGTVCVYVPLLLAHRLMKAVVQKLEGGASKSRRDYRHHAVVQGPRALMDCSPQRVH